MNTFTDGMRHIQEKVYLPIENELVSAGHLFNNFTADIQKTVNIFEEERNLSVQKKCIDAIDQILTTLINVVSTVENICKRKGYILSQHADFQYGNLLLDYTIAIHQHMIALRNGDVMDAKLYLQVANTEYQN